MLVQLLRSVASIRICRNVNPSPALHRKYVYSKNDKTYFQSIVRWTTRTLKRQICICVGSNQNIVTMIKTKENTTHAAPLQLCIYIYIYIYMCTYKNADPTPVTPCNVCLCWNVHAIHDLSARWNTQTLTQFHFLIW